MNGCFIGRGSLLVSVLGTSGGFFTLSGESEVTLDFEEDNESIFDARSGVNERIDWYVRNYRASVKADCFRIEKDAIENLLKSTYTAVGINAASIDLPNPVVVGRDYLLRPNLTAGSVSVQDATATAVPAGDYTIDEQFGLINFSATPGTQPYTVALSSAGHSQFALNGKNQILVEALVKGINKITGKGFMAHFYRLALDIASELKIVQKEFGSLPIQMQAIPDKSQPLDATLGQYGRIILL